MSDLFLRWRVFANQLRTLAPRERLALVREAQRLRYEDPDARYLSDILGVGTPFITSHDKGGKP